MNWDSDYRKMLRIFPLYLRLGNPLKDEDIAQAERIAHLLKDSRDDGTLSMQLCAYAVAWVLLNPKVLPPLECYSRHHTSRYAQHLFPKAKIFLTALLK